MDATEVNDIVIVGGGLCGLATAVALHRKGIKSIVLERSETLRDTGGAIGTRSNAWRALDQLGVGSKLRPTAVRVLKNREISLDKGGSNEETSLANDETRCLKRSDLITTLADALPPGTIQFGRQVVSVKLDPSNSYPTVQLHDGSSIVAKILIGCDGAHSVVADFLELKPTKEFGLSVTRGLTHYSNGHSVPHEIVRVTKNDVVIGRAPIDDKSAYWFVAQPLTSEEHAKISQRPELIRESTLHAVEGFSTEFVQLIEDSELESLTLTHLRYRHPCDLLLGKFRKGTVTVAGDAMHVMGPFLGQGGAAGLEDAIVLARCLSQKFVSTVDRPITSESQTMTKVIMRGVEEAMDRYVKERRMRVVRLSTQSYLTGLLLAPSSRSVKSACNVSMAVLFRNPSNHSQYDCGVL
ncbi:hypothetical protein Vadar_006097 [Vaccinium darrowii]|uniref:Uncharacterized protein n=1 Tax=Vaccinium darrowii TaxID=229202 RepID=A0ACB7WY60_9ERIC|nr:hypothetical protein Vadar_006097 [Vaccinium darrowii]